MKKLKDRLTSLGNRVLETERFGKSSTMETLPEWTSLAHVQLLGELANEFSVDVEIEDAYRLDSFGLLRDYIAARLTPASAPQTALRHTKPPASARFSRRAPRPAPMTSFLSFPRRTRLTPTPHSTGWLRRPRSNFARRALTGATAFVWRFPIRLNSWSIISPLICLASWSCQSTPL